MIATSDGAATASVRSNARRADKSADHPSFLDSLAAASPPVTKVSTDATVSANEDVNPVAKGSDRKSEVLQAALQPKGHGASVRDGGKQDKRADLGRGEDAPAESQQTNNALTPTAPAAAPPVSQSIAQSPAADGDDESAEVASVGALVTGQGGTNPVAQAAQNAGPVGSNSTNSQPADLRMIAQSGSSAVDDGADQPASAANDNKSGTALNDLLTTNAGQPTGQMQSGDSKPAANGRSDGHDPQISPPPMDSVNPAVQTATATPSATDSAKSDTTAQVTLNAGTVDGSSMPAPNPKPAVKDKMQTNGSDQAAPRIGDPSPTITGPASREFVTATDGKDKAADNNPVPAATNGDDKAAHSSSAAAPQPQLELAAPVIHTAAQTNPAPQGLMTIDSVDANLPASAPSATVNASVHVTTADPVLTPNLDTLAVSIVARSLSGAKQFEIRLDPPELGRVDVRLSIDASGKTQAHMTADQPQTLDLLKKDAPTLTQALRDAGLDVSQGGLNFSLRGQGRQNNDGSNGADQGRRTNLTATRTINAAQSPTALSFNGAAADARVDIHV
jgi:flagellar hook-length control protein FliK